MKRHLIYYWILLGTVGCAVAMIASGIVKKDEKRYVRMDNAVHQVLTGIPTEQTLVDFCYRLRTVRGVTGVSYRDYTLTEKKAVVTVFYDPRETSARQVRILMSYPYILWQKPLAS